MRESFSQAEQVATSMPSGFERQMRANPPVERDRREASLLGALRGFAAPAAPHLAR